MFFKNYEFNSLLACKLMQNKIKATWLYGLLQQQQHKKTSLPIIYLQVQLLEIIKMPR